MNTTKAVVEWDVRDGAVWRDGHMVSTFSLYALAHPDGMTVAQWEESKWRQVHSLACGYWPAR